MDPKEQIRSVVNTLLFGGDSILLAAVGRKPNRFLRDWLVERIAERLPTDDSRAGAQADAAAGGGGVATRTRTRTRALTTEVVMAEYGRVWTAHERAIIDRMCSPLRACAGCPRFAPLLTYEGIDEVCRFLDEDPDQQCPNNQFRF